MARRYLLAALRKMKADGGLPESAGAPGVYLRRAVGALLPRGVDWREATNPLVRATRADIAKAAPHG